VSDGRHIFKVYSVAARCLKSNPPQLAVSTHGIASTRGWTQPRLIPHEYDEPPEDGIIEYDFVADPPETRAQRIVTPISSSYFTCPIPDWVKGVRVIAEKNSETMFLADYPLIARVLSDAGY
jgi:hypothetical protein